MNGRLWCRVVRVYDDEQEEFPVAEFRFSGPSQEIASHYMASAMRGLPALQQALARGSYLGQACTVKQAWITVPAHELHQGTGATED